MGSKNGSEAYAGRRIPADWLGHEMNLSFLQERFSLFKVVFTKDNDDLFIP
jgi:hypothetical protein